MSVKNIVYALLGIILVFISCKKTENSQPQENPGLAIPDYIPEPHYKFENNPKSLAGFELGRMLFYDPILSSDSTVSCGTCHAQVHGFSDHSLAFSNGVNSKIGTRNSPPIFNLAWHPSFMWDGGINHIEIMPLGPITNPLEMNETIPNVLLKLNRNSAYKEKFLQVFGKQKIDDQMMFKAMAQFIGSVYSFNSKYDQVRQNMTSFSDAELKGYSLFKQNCNSCHAEPLFTDFSYRNNGLDSIFKDKGRFLINLDNNDLGKFKVPSLRNVELTYPYMHDGRLKNLSEVILHYSEKVVHSTTLDDQLKSGIPMTNEEKKQLIAFLKTLTDYSLLSNSQYAEH